MGGGADLSRAIGKSRRLLPLSVSCLPSDHETPDAEQVQLLTEICNTVPDDASKVKCIGVLECLAVHPPSVEANKVFRSQNYSHL
jgi:hypothetical protein